MSFARAAAIAMGANLLVAGAVLVTAGSTLAGLGIVAGAGLIFGLLVPLGDDGLGCH